ncbi:SPOR domain-containing protein [Erythrobacter mangrovi]|uniref:SPOR domain-containing protein n=1 Tax=Erythrobacter mangrovi TaxID=2739433 RepID=A0A7D4CNF7_9SPHN|nr:SPOR domain-containing protein [Erythrobacter mangrovi]QKG72028.1 SPOR domain-containing protein [Erythrobacter mangrovi]
MSTDTNAKTRRLVQLAVTTALATTALAGCTGKVAPSHAYSASQAEAALAKGQHDKAIANAEAAVLAAPRDAYTRTLLGNAYLEAGRFQSAATAFGEAMELGDSGPRTVISYALALTAQGNQAAALDLLHEHRVGIDPGDYGLAVALAGRPQEGVHVLSNALRGGQNTTKVRQNLAYAFALSGDWANARLLAAQDIPGDELGERLAQWALLAQAEVPTQRVAGLLGVSISADPGQPAMLALANHPAVEQLAAETVEASEGMPETSFALASELAASESAPQFDDSSDAALADAGLSNAGGIRFVSREVVQPIPSTRTSAAPRAAAAPRFTSGDYNVQLGSFSSMSDAQEAWKRFQRRYPELGEAERVITKARVNGKIYYRVAAAGFAKASAASMCRTVKGKGGGCIAYAASNPLPGALDVTHDEVRVAAR